MRHIKTGDHLVLRENYGRDYSPGTRAVALSDWSGRDGDCYGAPLLLVRFEDGKRNHVYGWRFDVVETAADVDALIAEYAKRLRNGIDNDTMVAPYSEIGIFTAFLMDYKKLESQ